MKVLILTVCLFAFLSAFSTRSFAVDFTVNLITDEHDASTFDGMCDVDLAAGGNQCSIRAAVEQANNLPSNDRVLFDLPANSIITLTSINDGQITIDNNGTSEIIGTGANILTIDGGVGINRIFRISNTTVTISGVTLTGGDTGSSLNNNSAGGAISSQQGSLTLDRVLVTGNSAPNNSGGGIFLVGGTHRFSNSTFSKNTAQSCGGFAISGGVTLTVNNSTISNNTSAYYGGGFCNQQSRTTLRNVTITNNSTTVGSAGGGFYLQTDSIINLGNTIVAGNKSFTEPAGNFAPEIGFNGSVFISAGGNLIGDEPGDSTNTLNPITYHPTDIRDVNPLLGALGNNGGTTPTHALLAGSPAIDTGLNALAVNPFNNSILLTDQRGFARFVDGDRNGTATVDIGAFEFPATTAATISISGRVINRKNRGVANAIVQITDQNGETQTTRTNVFGYYNFAEIRAGETYIFNVFAKRFQFDAQVINITESLDELDFVVR